MNIEELQKGDYLEYIPPKLMPEIIENTNTVFDNIINRSKQSSAYIFSKNKEDLIIEVVSIYKPQPTYRGYEPAEIGLKTQYQDYQIGFKSTDKDLIQFIAHCNLLSTESQRSIESQLKENQLLQTKLNSALSLIPTKPGMRIIKEIKFNTSIAFSYFIQYTHRDKTRALVERLDGSVTELELGSFIFLT
jgi:hypothetical protein